MKSTEKYFYQTLSRIANVTTLIDRYTENLEENAESITWADMGKITYIAEKLEEIKQTLSEK